MRDRLARGEHPLILDVRGPDEFDGPLGHIDGARNVPLPELPRHFAEIGRETGPDRRRLSDRQALLASRGVARRFRDP